MNVKTVSDRVIQLADESFEQFLSELEDIESYWDADHMDTPAHNIEYVYSARTRKDLKNWYTLTLDENPHISHENIQDELQGLVLNSLGYEFSGYNITKDLEYRLEKVFDPENNAIEFLFRL